MVKKKLFSVRDGLKKARWLKKKLVRNIKENQGKSRKIKENQGKSRKIKEFSPAGPGRLMVILRNSQELP